MADRSILVVAAVVLVCVYFVSLSMLESHYKVGDDDEEVRPATDSNAKEKQQGTRPTAHDTASDERRTHGQRTRRRGRRRTRNTPRPRPTRAPTRSSTPKPKASNTPTPTPTPVTVWRPLVDTTGKVVNGSDPKAVRVPDFAKLVVAKTLGDALKYMESYQVHLKTEKAAYPLHAVHTLQGLTHKPMFGDEGDARAPREASWPTHHMYCYLLELEYAWMLPSGLVYDQLNMYEFRASQGVCHGCAEQIETLHSGNVQPTHTRTLHFPYLLDTSHYQADQPYESFVLQTLGSFMQVLNFVRENPQVALLVPDPHEPWMLSAWQAIGLQSRLVIRQPATTYYVDHLFLPRIESLTQPARESVATFPRAYGLTHPSSPRKVLCILNNPDGSSPYGDADLGKRFCELMQTATVGRAHLEFHIVRDYSDSGLIASLFAQARLVVGMSSPAFVNLVFSSANTHVLEVAVGDHRVSRLHYHITQAVGAHYWLLHDQHNTKLDLHHLHNDLDLILTRILDSAHAR